MPARAPPGLQLVASLSHARLGPEDFVEEEREDGEGEAAGSGRCSRPLPFHPSVRPCVCPALVRLLPARGALRLCRAPVVALPSLCRHRGHGGGEPRQEPHCTLCPIFPSLPRCSGPHRHFCSQSGDTAPLYVCEGLGLRRGHRGAWGPGQLQVWSPSSHRSPLFSPLCCRMDRREAETQVSDRV